MRCKKKSAVLLVAVMLMALLAGCGEVVMKEFKAPNETFSIWMDETWGAEDMGNDGALAIFNKSGTEGIVIIQFRKNSEFAVSDIDGAKEAAATVLSMSGMADAEAPEIPVLENVCAQTAQITLDGQNEESYTVYGESDYAHYSMTYVAVKMTEKKKDMFKTACAGFAENAPEVENNFMTQMSDTILWMNGTNAVLTRANNWDYKLFGGLPANDESKAIEAQLLEDWWGVTDRQSAEETMQWILSEGHRSEFNETMGYYGVEGLADVEASDRVSWFLDNFDATEEQARSIADAYAFYEENGDRAIAGWDYGRAMSLLGYYYIAGYYTETEALDKSLEIAGEIQSLFTSWDEFMESYFVGYEYWSDEDSAERRAIYEELKAEEGSPYDLDFGMTLEKTW